MQNKPIRILQYIGSLNSGGSQSMIMNIYRNIDRSKIQFDFIVDRKNELLYKKEIEEMGGNVYIFNEYFNGKNFFKYKKQWINFFCEHKEYKIIHCHVRSVASIVLKISKKYKLCTICHSHSTSNGKGFKSIIKKLLQRKIKLYCDYFFACSKESALWLYGKKIADSSRCIIINNAIDCKMYSFNKTIRNKVRHEFKIDDKIVIGQVGRLEEVKNQSFTLELLKHLLNYNSNYYLLIIGTGSLKEQLMDKIRENKLEKNVMILHDRNDVNELLQAMDIFVMPSLWEGLPLALVEAQASSLPCIISNNVTDGIIIKNLVTKLDLSDFQKWIDSIKKLAGNTNRINQYHKIIKSGFDINENVRIVSNFYLNLLH